MAGVSVATVSNVLNGHAHVRPKTRAKVLDAVQALGYRASRAAKSLPAGRTYLLAYGLSGGTPHFLLDTFLRQIVVTASQSDLEFLIFTRQPGQGELDPYAELLGRGGADGFVLSDIGYEDPRVRFLHERDIPFACFGQVDEPEGVMWVDVDGAAGTRAAVEHVNDLGHDRVAFVGWPEGSATGDHRHAGFVEATQARGISADRVVRTTNEFDEGRKLVAHLLADFDPTAVVCVSDHVALGVIAGLRDADLAPGRDVVVTGFDDIPAASLTAPALTSVRQPIDKVGSLLAERLVARLSGAEPPESVLIEPELVVRESTTGIPQNTVNPTSAPMSPPEEGTSA